MDFSSIDNLNYEKIQELFDEITEGKTIDKSADSSFGFRHCVCNGNAVYYSGEKTASGECHWYQVEGRDTYIEGCNITTTCPKICDVALQPAGNMRTNRLCRCSDGAVLTYYGFVANDQSTNECYWYRVEGINTYIARLCYISDACPSICKAVGKYWG